MIAPGSDPEIQILLLEDVPADVELVRQALQSAEIPAVIRQVDRKDEYVRALETLRPDVILADHALPSFRNAEALKLARSRYPDIPFIFVSGAVGEELAVEAVHEGATDYVLKDHLMRLGPAVRRALHEASGRREQLRAEEALRLILENALDAVTRMDAAGIVTGWNPQAERLFGWTAVEALGRPMADLIIPERLRDEHRRGLKRYLESGQGPILGRRVEMTALHRNGREFLVELTVTALRQEEGTSFCAFLRDISGPRRLATRLAVEHSVAKILAEAAEADAAIAGVLEAMGRGLKWDVAIFWRVDPDVPALAFSSAWSREPGPYETFTAASRTIFFGRGRGLPGRAWELGTPAWMQDGASDDAPSRADLFKAAGLRGAFAFPVQDVDGVLGVVEVCCRREAISEPDLLETLGAVGRQVGQFLRRKKGEEAVRAGEQHLRLIADAMPSLISHIDRDWRYVFVNRAYKDWFGVNPSEVPGRPVWDVMGRRAFEAVRPYGERALRGERVQYEALVPFDVGGPRWIAANYVPDMREDGTVSGFFVLGTDITARKRAEETASFLSEATRLLAASLDVETTLATLARLAVPRIADWCTIFFAEEQGIRPVVLAHKDPSKVREVEDLLARFPLPADLRFGHAHVIRTGKSQLFAEVSDHMLVAAARSPEHLAGLRSLGLRSAMTVPMIAGGKTLAALTLATSESGHRYTPEDLAFAEEFARRAALAIENARLYQAVKRESDERMQALETIRELNENLERRVADRTAALEEITRELDSFASTVAHDLRAPLRIMKGFSELLLEDYSGKVLDAAGQECARKIDQASVRMSRLVDDLLAYSRLARADVPIHSVDLDAAVAETLKNMAEEIRGSKAEMTVERPLGRVLGHGGFLGQVLGNLLGNALKFVPPGAAPRVRLRTTPAPDGRLRLWVEDNGIGIALEYHDRIFNVFERLHRPDQYPGTGLGLAIVRRAVDRMGGEVGVESVPDQGSRFWIELPKA
jgi:PAS domain S-box-containing protein